LLKLQSNKFADPGVRDVFTECRDRINAMARLHEELYNEHGQSHRARIESRDRHRAPQTQYGNHDAPSAQFTIGRRGGTSIHLNSPAAETDCARGAPKIVRRMQIIQAVGIAPTQRAFHQGNLRPRSQMERF